MNWNKVQKFEGKQVGTEREADCWTLVMLHMLTCSLFLICACHNLEEEELERGGEDRGGFQTSKVISSYGVTFIHLKKLRGGLVSPRGMWSWQALLWFVGTRGSY